MKSLSTIFLYSVLFVITSFGFSEEGTRTVRDDGKAIIRYADGSYWILDWIADGDFIRPGGIAPDRGAATAQDDGMPPPLPKTLTWLNNTNDQLFEIIKSHLGLDQSSINRYVKSEIGQSTFTKISRRTQLIKFFTNTKP
jgi:hypothetical protein